MHRNISTHETTHKQCWLRINKRLVMDTLPVFNTVGV